MVAGERMGFSLIVAPSTSSISPVSPEVSLSLAGGSSERRTPSSFLGSKYQWEPGLKADSSVTKQ